MIIATRLLASPIRQDYPLKGNQRVISYVRHPLQLSQFLK